MRPAMLERILLNKKLKSILRISHKHLFIDPYFYCEYF